MFSATVQNSAVADALLVWHACAWMCRCMSPCATGTHTRRRHCSRSCGMASASW